MIVSLVIMILLFLLWAFDGHCPAHCWLGFWFYHLFDFRNRSGSKPMKPVRSGATIWFCDDALLVFVAKPVKAFGRS